MTHGTRGPCVRPISTVHPRSRGGRAPGGERDSCRWQHIRLHSTLRGARDLPGHLRQGLLYEGLDRLAELEALYRLRPFLLTPGLAQDADPILVGEFSERRVVVASLPERRH